MFGLETCRVNSRAIESKSAARTFTVLCGWAVVKAKPGAVSASDGTAGPCQEPPEIADKREIRGGLAAFCGISRM